MLVGRTLPNIPVLRWLNYNISYYNNIQIYGTLQLVRREIVDAGPVGCQKGLNYTMYIFKHL